MVNICKCVTVLLPKQLFIKHYAFSACFFLFCHYSGLCGYPATVKFLLCNWGGLTVEKIVVLTKDIKKTQVILQDNIETTLLATGAPVSACVVLLNNGENLANQKSELSNTLWINWHIWPNSLTEFPWPYKSVEGFFRNSVHNNASSHKSIVG